MTLHLMGTQKVEIRNLHTNIGIPSFELGTSDIALHTSFHYVKVDSIKIKLQLSLLVIEILKKL